MRCVRQVPVTTCALAASAFSASPRRMKFGSLWKLPAEVRKPLRVFWTRPKFYEALGSQIATISESARETIEASQQGYGNVPLVTISMTDPGDHQLRHQDELARLSTRGRHVVASHSGHWIPLDEPELIIQEIKTIHDQLRT